MGTATQLALAIMTDMDRIQMGIRLEETFHINEGMVHLKIQAGTLNRNIIYIKATHGRDGRTNHIRTHVDRVLPELIKLLA